MTALADEEVLAAYRLHLDKQAVIDVAIAYTYALDSNEFDLLDDVFLPDATVNYTDENARPGRDGIKDRIAEALGPLDNSQHICSNHEVHIAGDTASHRCYLQAQHIRDVGEGSPLFIVAGRYVDDLVRTPDGWRIKHRDLIRMWTDGNPAVVMAGRAEG